MQIVDEVSHLELKNWYIAAGCVFQTIWNFQDGKSLMSGVHDIDLVYFDSENQSIKFDKNLEQKLSKQFSCEFDVHNEAYMHLWQGRNIAPYTSCENAIKRWIATTHAIGITGNSSELQFFAPYGLSDIFDKNVKPIVHADNSRELYDANVIKWQARFDGLTVYPWNEK